MEGRKVGRDASKLVYHGAIATAFTKIGCDSIKFGLDKAFDPETGVGDTALGFAIATCGAANIKAGCRHAKKAVDAGRQLVVDIACLDHPDIYDEDEPIDVDI